MKICLECQTPYTSEKSLCAKCGHQVMRKNGMDVFAPDLEGKEEGYNPDFYDTYAHLENGHFWFQARSKLIVWALKKYAPRMSSFLDVGCGTGFVLRQVEAAFPQARLHGSEMFSTALKYASSSLQGVEFIQMDARHIPYTDEFEAIGSFDVIEHIEEDTDVLQQIYRAIKPGGIMIITVPQHQWLWSQMDEYSCHVRRYDAAELHRKVRETGFEILRSTSFVTLLLPAMMIARGTKKHKHGNAIQTAELVIPKVLNYFFGFVMLLEAFLVKVGVSLPIGASRLIVARK